MDTSQAIAIIKAYGNNIGIDSVLEALQVMQEDECKSKLERCAFNLFMHEGRKMFESIKIQVTI